MSSSDSDRPAVLAHQRFLDDRESLAGLNLAQRFRRIHDTNMWGAQASTSGLGSEIDATAALRAELPRLLRKLAVTSLLDAPCGDAGWISRVDLGVRYLGVDIVPALIERLQARGAAMRRDPVPRRAGASVVCQYRPRGGEFSGLRRYVADHDHVPRVADQWRLRGRRV